MEILNLGGAAENNSAAPKARKKLRVLLGIGALAAVTGIGSTLAANISLNGGGNVEFGQGVATTAACDDDITLTPISEFSNTEEESTFAMTAIQVSGIDMTPEGWDFTLNDGSGAWATGFTPRHYDDEIDQWIDGSWNTDNASHSGQYKASNGSWINTCANKSLMIHAYTDTPGFDYATDGWDINSPLILNGANGHRPDNNYPVSDNSASGFNRGVGFRVDMYDYSLNGSLQWDDYLIVEDNSDWASGADWDPLDRDFYNGGSDNTFNDSTFIVYLDAESSKPPVDSKMIDKLTIESAATTPSGWAD